MRAPPPQFRAKGVLILALLLAVWMTTPALLRAQASGNSQQPSASGDGHSTPSDTEGTSVTGPSKDNQSADAPSTTVKLHIKVTGSNDKPVSNASVYVRFYTAGGFLRHDKLAEMDLKTNQDGTVKVPEIPQGKIMIQVVAPGWHTYGKWYDVAQSEQTISIQLVPPPHWY